MKVYIGADHAGFELKEKLKTYLNKNYNLIDLGNTKYDKNDDYPKFASKVAKKVSKSKSFGILICGSGQGVCIAANKIKGIRAVLAEHIKDSKMARLDDDANVLCLQGRLLSFNKAKKICDTFLQTEFTNFKRHLRRINEIKKLE